MACLLGLCLALVAGHAAAAGNVTLDGVKLVTQQANNPTGKYRVFFSKTYGDDHVCLTEIEFYNVENARLNATYASMSTCYGCASCTGCEHRYGNPKVLFDMDATSDDPSAWSCTAPGTFIDSAGSQQVTFTLSERPNIYILKRPQVNGDWVSRDFSLEEELSDGSWQVLDSAVDVEKLPDQSREVGIPTPTKAPGPSFPPWSYATPEKWVSDYPKCGGSQQSPIDLELIANTANVGDSKLPYSYQPMYGRALANSGAALQVAGDLGSLNLPGGEYKASQFHFHFPPEHRIGGDEHLAVGELQIVHQKVGSKGTDDIAIVSIMLHLPLEHDQLTEEEQFFIDIGMLAMPPKGAYSQPLSKPINISSSLAEQLDSNFWQYTGSLATPPCTEGVQWFVMEKYARISGVVVQQFQNLFQAGNSRSLQKLNGRVVWVNSLPGA